MPVPKRKRSRARIRKAHANKGLKAQAYNLCNNCQSANMPHQACNTCGFYKGAKVFETKLDRAVKRGLAKQAKQQNSSGSSESAETQSV